MSKSTIIFYDSSFPLDSRLSADYESQLVQLGNVVRANSLGKALQEADGGSFINMHAPYFPKEAWSDILDYLKRGGSLISIGGAPFKRPVSKNDAGVWEPETEQTAYHREIHIHEALPVDAAPINGLSAMADIPLLQGKESLFEISNTWNLVPHVTKTSDLPHQMGSAGPMDAQLYPLLKGVSAEGREVAAPVVLWENTKGMFAGARWLFVNQPLSDLFWQSGGAQELSRWAQFCGEGVTELSLKPNYASFEPGERAMLTLQAQHLSRSAVKSEPAVSWSFSLVVQHDNNPELSFTTNLQEDVASKQLIIRIPVPLELVSGYYSV